MTPLLREIDWDKTNILTPLVSDYVAGKKELSHLYKYPFNLDSFADIIADKAKDETDRKLLVEVLQAQYADIVTTNKVYHNIESLLNPNTFTITAAHQPCLFMGPLFNIYKIAGAINTAQQLNRKYPSQNFVPVFWMGSEDHDIAELNNAYVKGKKFEWENPGSGAIGRLNTSSMKPILKELRDSGISGAIVDVMEEGLKKFDTFGKYTQYLVNEIFKEDGLVVIDQDDLKLKKSFGGIIQEEIANATAASVLQPNIDFLQSNYKVQATPREINFFYLGEGYRERIIYNSLTQRFTINNKSLSFDLEEMDAEIAAHPERFSPNVIFRPLYQEHVLPNLAFIGGGGELSYWLELEPLFDHYQINFPMLMLRTSAAIISTPVQKKLEKLGLTLDDFMGDLDALINRYVKANMPEGANLNGERGELENIFDEIGKRAQIADNSLLQNVAAQKQKLIQALDEIESKIVKAIKRKEEESVNRIRSVYAALYPENNLQERRESFLPYYSKEFIAEIIEQTNPFDNKFKIFLKD